MARKNAMVNRPIVKGKQSCGGISKKSPGKDHISISTLRKLLKQVENYSGGNSENLHEVIKHSVT
jgi:hypothetical protein